MTDTQVMDIAQQAMMLGLKLAGPFLGAALLVGVLIGMVQAATQLQEPTIAFVPKVLAVAAVLAFGGAWMLHELVGFFQQLVAQASTLIG